MEDVLQEGDGTWHDHSAVCWVLMSGTPARDGARPSQAHQLQPPPPPLTPARVRRYCFTSLHLESPRALCQTVATLGACKPLSSLGSLCRRPQRQCQARQLQLLGAMQPGGLQHARSPNPTRRTGCVKTGPRGRARPRQQRVRPGREAHRRCSSGTAGCMPMAAAARGVTSLRCRSRRRRSSGHASTAAPTQPAQMGQHATEQAMKGTNGHRGLRQELAWVCRCVFLLKPYVHVLVYEDQ